MFIKIGLKYNVLNNDTVNESQTVRINTDSGNIVVMNVYVAPNVDIDKSSMNTLFKEIKHWWSETLMQNHNCGEALNKITEAMFLKNSLKKMILLLLTRDNQRIRSTTVV